MSTRIAEGRLWLVVALLCAAGAGTGNLDAAASAAEVPRILLIGDSYNGFMWGYRSFKSVLPSYAGLEDVREVGVHTAIMGVKACQYKEASYLEVVTEELTQRPTIDIVSITLGANDFFSGTDSLGDETEWNASMTPEQAQALFDAIAADTAVVVDHVLSLRPDIRVVICGYCYGNGGLDPEGTERLQLAWADMGRAQKAVADARDRVFYVQNFGLMQYHFGVPEADPPVPAYTLPAPGGYPDYDPFPGGDPSLNCPLYALADNYGHLTQEGFEIVARRCIDEFFGEWLSWPRVLEIVALESKAPLYTFRVTFSEAVSGVDTNDFAAFPSEAVATSVVGGDAVYVVTVDMNGAPGAPELAAVDDDTILDGDSQPLGGPGVGNGAFSANGPFLFEDLQAPEPGDFDVALRYVDEVFFPYRNEVPGLTFAPEACDVNGGIGSFDPVIILGNGLLDSYEFALIHECVTNSSIDLSEGGGVSHAVAVNAWENNYTQMFADLGGEGSMVSILLPGMDTVMAGLMTLGDPLSYAVPLIGLTALSSAIEDFPLHISPPNIANYILLPQFFGLDGDADNDGFTNRQEYEFFAPLKGRHEYVAAALDPDIFPGSGEGEGSPAEGEGEAQEGEQEGERPSTHTADQDGDNLIGMPELLRVVQFYNAEGYHCEAGTEDGYATGPGDTGCAPHTSDYNAQDWHINLSELLRLIQFYNSSGYHACPEADPPTEDGFCVGPGR